MKWLEKPVLVRARVVATAAGVLLALAVSLGVVDPLDALALLGRVVLGP